MPSNSSLKPPRSLWRAILPWAILGVIISILIVLLPALRFLQLQPDGTDHIAVGKQLPGVQLTALTAEEPLTGENLKGKITLINFWGTWCYPCVLEMPYLSALYQRLQPNRDFQFVSVSCSGGDVEDLDSLRSETEDFLTQANMTFGTYADPTFMTRLSLAATADLQEFAYPTTVLLDRNGRIQGLWIGYEKGVVEEMEALIRKLLASHRSNGG